MGCPLHCTVSALELLLLLLCYKTLKFSKVTFQEAYSPLAQGEQSEATTDLSFTSKLFFFFFPAWIRETQDAAQALYQPNSPLHFAEPILVILLKCANF